MYIFHVKFAQFIAEMASYLAVFLIIVIKTELKSFFNAISLILHKVKCNLRHAGSPKVIKSEQRGFEKGALQEQINTLKIREKVIHKIYENKNFNSRIKSFVD